MFHIKIMPWTLLVVCLIALCSCKGEERKQGASDGISGTIALEHLASFVDEYLARKISEGVQNNILAAAGVESSELPPPTQTPKQIAEDPERYVAQSEDNKKASLSWGVWSIIGGGVLAVLGFIKTIPGAHQPIVGALQWMLENKADRRQRAAKDAANKAMPIMIKAVERFGGGDAKAYVKRKLDSVTNDELMLMINDVITDDDLAAVTDNDKTVHGLQPIE